MDSDVKLKIDDIPRLRENLCSIYEKADQIILAKWSVILSKHVFELAEYDYSKNEIVSAGFATNESLRNGEENVGEIRKAGFKVHELAKKSEDKLIKAALRVAGHAVYTAHMRRHAIIASDYAVKAVNIKYTGDMYSVRQERKWQINTLRLLLK